MAVLGIGNRRGQERTADEHTGRRCGPTSSTATQLWYRRRFQKSQQRAFRAQQAYAAQPDRLSTSLTDQAANLANLRSAQADLMGSVSSTVSGFDGGITGHNDTRTTFDTILKGQQYNAKEAQAFNVNTAKLSKLGLSNASLSSIASAGVDGGGVTAAALAKASAGQIKQLNSVTNQVHRIGDNVGDVVAGQFYEAGIAAGTGLVKQLQSQIGAIQKVMNSIAYSVISTLTTKLQIHSPSRVMHDLGGHTAQGFANGIAGSTPAVIKAIDNMAAIPNMTAIRPMQVGGSSVAGHLDIDVQVNLDGKWIDDRIDVKINGNMVELAHSFNKASMQSW